MARVKTPEELGMIERAATIADESLAVVLSHGIIGLTEKELRDRLDDEMARRGSDSPSFPTIVATGPNGFHPHHVPTDSVVDEGDMVVIDMGATVGGWMSDMTRTVRVGTTSAELEEMHVLVRAAQEAGLAAVRPGVTGREVDEAVRAVFRAAGVEHEFVHGTGHGVGTVIHEQPILNRSCETALMEGEVVTVEPGLYREGVGGVRIEDLVVVTTTGCRILTRTPKELSCPPSAPTT
jgi:Xaa-Pro aminopeptidase